MRIKVAVIDLDRPLLPVEDLDGYATLKVLVRVHGVPLGSIDVPVVDGRCSAERIRASIGFDIELALTRHLLSDALATGSGPDGFSAADLSGARHPCDRLTEPFVTVAVCTRNRAEELRTCLAALARLDYPDYEVIVIDNAPSTSETEDLVRSEYPAVRYVREPRPGLDWARNRAIAEARGEILAYTDDDVVVDPRWLTALAEAFADPSVAAVTGLVVPYELETQSQQLFERYGGFGRGFERRWYGAMPGDWPVQVSFLGAGQFGTGANMAYRRDLFAEIGLFDPGLDVGTVTNGGGDLEMFFRVLKHGHILAYEPAAIVLHRHRREYGQLRTQLTNNGIGFYSHLVRSALAYPDERVNALRLGIWWLWWWNIRRLLISYIRPARFPRDLIIAELKGSIIGLVRYPVARREAQRIGRDATTYGVIVPDAKRQARSRPAQKRPTARVAVRTLDVAAPVEPFEDLDGYDAIRIVVTRGGRALKDSTLATYGKPLGARRLREALAREMGPELVDGEVHSYGAHFYSILEAVSAQIAPRPDRVSESPRLAASVPVSIVIATYDRPVDLRRCLASLMGQRTDRQVEIIVVDNHPGSGLTPPVVAEFAGVRLVEEERAGLSYARNAGIIASQGAIIVATDDDVVAPPEWVERLIAPFARADVAVVTGNVLPLELETRAQQLFERYGGLGRGFVPLEANHTWFNRYRRRAAPTWELGATACAAFRATVFANEDIGLFDETLGAGSPTGCSEDTYLFYKVLKAGLTIRYEPDAFVWHRHRREIQSLRRQLYNYSKGHVAYHLTTVINDGDLRGMLDVFIRLPRWRFHQLGSQVKRGMTGRDRYPLSLVIAETLGNLAGPYALWRSRQRVRRLGRQGPYTSPAERRVVSTLNNHDRDAVPATRA